MAFGKVKREIASQPDQRLITDQAGSFYLRRLRPLEHWQTVGQMFRNYPGVDTNFEQVTKGRLRPLFLKYIGMPLYFGLANEGWGLWAERSRLAGQIYLQHRRMVTHINDIEVNREFRGQGLSHRLLELAEQQARRRGKRYLTLAVTISNTRAVKLYRQSGFMDQHHRFFYRTRPWWSEAPTAVPPGQQGQVRLAGLKRAAARRNLRQFFELETRYGDPETAPVWEALYRPKLPPPGQGFSFAVYFNQKSRPQGHVDFFDWDGRGRWRVYTEPALWGTEQERGLFEALLRQAQSYNQLGLMTGTYPHHTANLTFAADLGLVEREAERMLMIKPLE